MTPHRSDGRESKVQSILEIASHIIQWTSGSSQTSSFPDLSLYLAALPLARNDVSAHERVKLDQKGVQLWNACCKLGNDEIPGDEKTRAHVAQTRAFAWLLVESAARDRPKDFAAATRKSLRSAIRAVKDCLAAQDLQLAAKIIERLADRQTQIQNLIGAENEEARDFIAQIQTEIYLLQMALAWKRERLDMAEHFLTRLNELLQHMDPSYQLKAVNLMYEIGHQLLQDKQNDIAVTWLARAASIIEGTKDAYCASDTQDLRLNVLHSYVRALLETNDPNAGTEAARVLAILKSDFGHKLAVTLLDIEILTRDPNPDVDAYCTELLKIIRTVHLIENNHKLIMYYTHHLKTLRLSHALKALKQYILQRLAPDDFYQRTENAIVTFIWMAVSDSSTEPSPAEINADLNLYHQIWGRRLSFEAAHAALLLLWKKIENIHQVASQKDVPAWCNVALNTLLGDVGDRNIGKIQRKMIVYHIEQPDLQAAKVILDEMNEKVKQHPLSLYLAYSVALRCHDEREAEASLTSIVKLRDQDNRLLLTCVGQAMKYGDQKQQAKLLQRILDKFGDDLPQGIDACTLLRCTARLLMSVVSQDKAPDPEMLSRLCSVFRTAASFSVKCNAQTSNLELRFTSDECEWFERNSYNAALQHSESWPAKYVIDLIEYSSQIQHPPGDLEAHTKIKQRSTTALFQTVLYVSEARRCDSSWTIEDLPRTSYHGKERPGAGDIRFHLYQCAFGKYTHLQQMLSRLQEVRTLEDELKMNLVTLLPLSFEALIFVESQTMSRSGSLTDISLVDCIDQASELNAPAKTFALLADLILSSAMSSREVNEHNRGPHLPLPIAITLLSKVINAIRSQSDYDIVKAARWIRCVVQLVLDHYSQPTPTGDEDDTEREQSMNIVHTIIDEALRLAHDAGIRTNPTSKPLTQLQVYPSDELHWLSTTLFNLGVDMYVAQKEDEAKKWVGKAIDIADALGRDARVEGSDGAGLARVLRERGGRMGWQF